MKKTLIAFFIANFAAYCQTDYSFIYNSGAIIDKGIELHDLEKYPESIIEFDRIDKLDAKYLTAQYEKILSLSSLKKNDEIKSILQNLYKNNRMPEMPSLYTVYGNFLSDQKELDEAEKIFKEGEKYLSNSSTHLYNQAILYIRKSDSQKALDILKKVVTINPNHASSHYLLGVLAFENGKITEGTLALLSYLVIMPTGRYSEDAILKLNAKFGENYLDNNKLVFSKTGDDFTEIETILRNQLPLKTAYKVNSEFKDVIIRQAQAVADYSVEHKRGNGFFENTYMPWLSDLVSKKQFEGFSYYILLSMEEKLGKKLTSQKKKILAFSDNYLQKEVWKNFATRKVEHFGKEEEVIITIEKSFPYLVGKQVNDKREGRYKLLNADGNIEAELTFSNNELHGFQRYFDSNGNIEEEKTFVNGKVDGKRTEYYANGSISIIENYKNGQLDGLSTSYYVNGGKSCEANFINGERDGQVFCYFENGKVKSERNFSNAKLNGMWKIYNEVGDLTESINYEDDLPNGQLNYYYDGKVISAQGTYSKGKMQQSYKQYYPNKALKKDSSYEAGKLRKVVEFYPTGKKLAESTLNDKEELENYIFYNENEEKYFEEKYKSGELKSGLQYIQNAPKPIEVSLSKKPFILNGLQGTTYAKGDFEKGKKQNEWNYYYTSGILKLKESYKSGNIFGVSTQYNRNGTLLSLINYKNDTINGVYEGYSFGKKKSLIHFENGRQNGPYKNFYKDGTTSVEGFSKNDIAQNKKIIYWQNGQIMSVTKYTNGVVSVFESYNQDGILENTIDYKNRTGKFTTKYHNGTIIREDELVNGMLNGKYFLKDKLNTPITEQEFENGMRINAFKSYSPLGTLYSEEHYYCGQLNGTNKYYDLVGNLRLTDQYTFGDENGATIRYYHNKSKIYEYSQADDLLEGDYTYYNLKGEKILKIFYTNNIAKYYVRLNKAGILDDKVEIKDGTAAITSNYPNGNQAIQITMNKGILNGLMIIKNADGKPEYQSTYKDNLFDGERIEYYASGKIYKKERLINGDFEGVQEYFKEDGKPWLSVTYKNDELHGDTKIYTNGVLSLTKKYNSDELVEIIQ